MNINTGITDMNGDEILLGMYVQNSKCRYLTYQIRIRDNLFVLHTGGSYKILIQDDARNNLKIIKNPSIDVLGFGSDLFDSTLIN
ncbi:hypothetical protein [Clostridium beijerinckii]|uniref:Uncharacterized protein n=1 Tax=Clostridium beijerinckii TaxID=1520 RepID=A0AAW3W3M8_CLOBE|nr:hypothetical protein [Clostridium beijerinckii]MBC2455646.1 hypothetical protein [Clostridium beijerinckii]MBC2473123.1 hypothetical protein [Clostridium beijerinckii]NOV62373.1 hypothetical protein [Clostridium beijerinckii]NOV68130.1 hypothetical protein [Clostridium beijerinckii]NOW30425.1 hypothetical protein [Clostridium beijerinckii]